MFKEIEMATQQIRDLLAESPCTGSCSLKIHNCYAGQWTVHGPHHFEVQLMKWCGGGTEQRHCPGKTEATKL